LADLLRAAALGAVPHGFSDRDGVTDANRPFAGRTVWLKQVHSPDVVTVREPWPEDARPPADALVTDRRGLLLAIVTADCAPVLLADREAGVVGAAHAGWRGAAAGVIGNTVAAMEAVGARRAAIAAAVGPCIAQASYEVGADMRADFAAEDARFFAPGAPDRWQFDLAGYVAARLADSGVGAIEVLGCDTYAGEDRFESYRRATHRGLGRNGRQVSLIGLA
jgi:YfiH family protein